MTKLYAVTDTVEDIFTGSSTTIVGVFSTIDKATAAVIAHREKRSFLAIFVSIFNPLL